MKYIIMCGGKYDGWEQPKQLTRIKGETVVGRTIRQLRENGVDDIAITTDDSRFKQFNVPLLHHDNYWEVHKDWSNDGYWVNCFYPTDDPVCYLLGDVIFSNAAIKKIVETETDSIEYFASAPPFAKNYCKPYAEPFAFKVVNTKYFHYCIAQVKKFNERQLFGRHPIAWELWQVIKSTPLNVIDYTNYTVINDYTCDIDSAYDVRKIEERMEWD